MIGHSIYEAAPPELLCMIGSFIVISKRFSQINICTSKLTVIYQLPQFSVSEGFTPHKTNRQCFDESGNGTDKIVRPSVVRWRYQVKKEIPLDWKYETIQGIQQSQKLRHPFSFKRRKHSRCIISHCFYFCFILILIEIMRSNTHVHPFFCEKCNIMFNF